MKLLRKLYYWFKVPDMMLKPFSKIHDDIVRYLIENYEIQESDRFTLKINDKIIWIGNMPYCVGIYEGELWQETRPSRETIFNLRQKLKAFNVKKLQDKENLIYKNSI